MEVMEQGKEGATGAFPTKPVSKSASKLSGSRVLDFRPIGLSLGNRAGPVLVESFKDFLAQEDIKLSIHHRSKTRITIKLLADRDTKGAETAILRQILVGIRFKGLRIGST